MGFFDGFEAGSQLDSYRIEATVARSGMASIYRAIDTRHDRVVAHKVPHPELGSDPIAEIVSQHRPAARNEA